MVGGYKVLDILYYCHFWTELEAGIRNHSSIVRDRRESVYRRYVYSAELDKKTVFVIKTQMLHKKKPWNTKAYFQHTIADFRNVSEDIYETSRLALRGRNNIQES